MAVLAQITAGYVAWGPTLTQTMADGLKPTNILFVYIYIYIYIYNIIKFI